MRSVLIKVYACAVLILFGVVGYMVGEYIYLKLSFEEIDKEIREYQNMPYLSRRLSVLQNEYLRIRDFEEEIRAPALVIGRILNVFDKYGVKVEYVRREYSEDLGEVYKASVRGDFRDVFFSLGEIEGLFLPIRFTRVYMSGDAENVSMVVHFSVVE